jgi:hypothetical protein
MSAELAEKIVVQGAIIGSLYKGGNMANSKAKGKRGEQGLVIILNEAFGDRLFRRTPHSGAFVGGKNREISENLDYKEGYVSDIITPANFNFILEHKFYNDISFWELFSDKSNWSQWIRQAEEDAAFVGKEPMVVIKYNRHKRIALVKSSYLMNFVTSLFIWKPENSDHSYSVSYLENLLKLPRAFWFSEDN